MDVSASDELVGSTVGGGRFRLDRLVGVGATGRVYLAEQVNLARRVAVKVLRSELAGNRDLAARFRREALLAASLSHPNIAAVIDCSRPGDDVPFIAMEYVRGKSLFRLLQSEFPLAIERTLDLFVQVLGGLEEAHEAGIVHADVKSPNVVVSQTLAGVEQPKIVDFGVAVLRRSAVASATMVCGTPEYLAPELIRGEAPSVASDIYGAGVILYELIAGAPPFSGESVFDTLHMHLADPVPGLPPTGSRALAARLEAIVGRALAKRPEHRFRSVAELRGAVIAASRHAEQAGPDAVVIAPREHAAGSVRHPRSSSPIASSRAQLAAAIRGGDRRDIGEAYLALAAELAAGDLGAAIRELEEGLDVVGFGHRDRSGVTAGRLGLALARRRDENGDRDGAIEVALRTLFHSQQVADLATCVEVHGLLETLYAAGGHDLTAARHRELGRRLAKRSD